MQERQQLPTAPLLIGRSLIDRRIDCVVSLRYLRAPIVSPQGVADQRPPTESIQPLRYGTLFHSHQ